MELHCVICKNLKCQEDGTHSYTSFQDFNQVLLNWKLAYSKNKELFKLREKISTAFLKTQAIVNADLSWYARPIFKQLDKIPYWGLVHHPSPSFQLIDRIFEDQVITRNQMMILLSALKEEKLPEFRSLKPLFQIVHKFKKNRFQIAQSQNFGALYQDIQLYLNDLYLQARDRICPKNNNVYRKISSASTCSNSSDSSFIESPAKKDKTQLKLSQQNWVQAESVLLDGFPYLSNRQQLNLSMSQLNDRVMVNYLPGLEKMKLMIDLEIRKNNLTPLMYRMLFNTLPNLISLDLRQTQNLSEQVIKSLSLLKNLRILYLSESIQNNYSQLQNCHKLQFLFLQGSHIDFQVLTKVVLESASLKFISLVVEVDNPETIASADRLYDILERRGGYLEIK